MSSFERDPSKLSIEKLTSQQEGSPCRETRKISVIGEHLPPVSGHKLLPNLENKRPTCAFVGCGYLGGQPLGGVEKGPQTLWDHKLIEEIAFLGWNVEDLGVLDMQQKLPLSEKDDPKTNGLTWPRTVGKACKILHDVVKEQSAQKKLVATCGGDHSLAIGSISGVAANWKDLCVIWVDAHGDINTPKSSPTGNIHGMPVAFLLGNIQGEKPGFEWLSPCLDPSRIVFIGLRDVDTGEKEILHQNGIKAFSMREVDKYGIGKVMEMALDHVNPKRDRPIHLSYDIDAIDPTVVPSTGTRKRGGLSFREACFVGEAVAETGLLVGIDLVELNPDIGTPEDVQQSAEVTISVAKSCLGEELLTKSD